MTEQPCKGCGKAIVWAKSDTGATIPLDPQAPVYTLNEDGTCARNKDAMVTHFATCPNANQFSKGGKK